MCFPHDTIKLWYFHVLNTFSSCNVIKSGTSNNTLKFSKIDVQQNVLLFNVNTEENQQGDLNFVP